VLVAEKMASSEAQRGHLRLVSSLDLQARPTFAGWQAMRALVRSRLVALVAREVLAVGAMLGTVGVVFWPLLAGIGVYAESDTFTYFYPVFATLHAALRAGELPFWTPYVFGGFPLFAEGQIGALYPPGLLAAELANPVQGFLLLRVFHVAVATLGAYALARALGIGAVGGVVGGLSFGLGGFVVAQQHHANMLAATVWLPLILACLELALARQGWAGHSLLGLAALLLGVEALATHVQPLMLSGAMIGAYVLVRQGWQALAGLRASGARRGLLPGGLLLVDAIATVIFVGAVGALIAAAQILPLYELSQESWRASGWSYQDAIEYSLPPINLVTLIFPFFFRSPDGGQWSLWQVWESVLYVGVVPLLLATVAVLAVRRWAVAFFAIAALVSGFAALGGYLPFDWYRILWHIPGMSLQRAPARFTLITALSLAMLAAFGAQWLTAAWRGAGRRARRNLLLAHLGVLALLAVIVVHLVIWRAWVQSDRAWAMQALAATYLAQAQDPLQGLQPIDAVLGLASALDLANPKTASPLGLLAGFGLLLLGWRELPRLRPLWQGALILLVAADLAIFASDFHPLVDVSYLGDPGPAGQMLMAKSDGWRVLTRPEVDAPQPNELLPHEIAEASGYSPLELDRHRWYAQSVQTVDNVLLDLWSVRWIVETAHPEPMPSYELVSFHPRRPLLVGGAGTPNGQIRFQPDPTQATQLRMISGLSGGEAIPDGEIVGQWLLTDADGVRYVLPVRAGHEIADWRPRAPGLPIAHEPIQTAATIRPGDDATERRLGYAEIDLPRRTTIVSLEYRHLLPQGRTILYGVALYDRQEDATSQVTREDRYRVAYQDSDVVVYENPAAYPRAFVVPEAVLAPDGVAAMARLREGPLDPRSQVVVESPPEGGLGPFGGTPAQDAAIVAEGNAVVDVQADAPAGGFLVLTDPYYPGWRAFVDGEEAPILRADYLFRAVALTPGSHVVRFTFAPTSFERGVTMSLAGLVIALGAILVGMAGPPLVRRPWRRRGRAPAGAAGTVAGSAPADAPTGDSAPAGESAPMLTSPVQQAPAPPAPDRAPSSGTETDLEGGS
jgi:hypothetical protein